MKALLLGIHIRGVSICVVNLIEMTRKKCLYCGGLFEQKKRGRPRLYCSDTCKRLYWKKKHQFKLGTQGQETNLNIIETIEGSRIKGALWLEKYKKRFSSPS